MVKTIAIDRLRDGYYLRWWYNGWHCWYFTSEGQAIDVEGEPYLTDVGEKLTLGDVNLTKEKLNAMRGLWRTTIVQMLTDDGWKACTIDDKEYDFGVADDPAAQIEFDLNIWAKVGTFTPLMPVNVIPAPPPPPEVVYGYLYNYFAVTDVRGIVASGWRVHNSSDREFLKNYLINNYPQYNYTSDNDNEHGKALKESGTIYWQSGQGDNVLNLNIRGSGQRRGDNGLFQSNRVSAAFFRRTIDAYSLISASDDKVSWASGGLTNQWGTEIRAVRDATPAEKAALADGDYAGKYTGNDGKVYATIYVGKNDVGNGYVILSSNLAETKFANGDWITGFDGGVYTPITNENWAAKTTEALCAYDDDMDNVKT